MMKVLAVDPGYGRLGIAILEQDKEGEHCLHSETFETNARDDINMRLYEVGSRIRKLVEQYKVDHLAIETLFFTNNQKTALQVSEARGIVIYVAQEHGLLVHEYSPLQIKAAVTGNGRADKRSVIDMVHRLVRLEDKKRHDDEYDAIACGLTCFAHTKN